MKNKHQKHTRQHAVQIQVVLPLSAMQKRLKQGGCILVIGLLLSGELWLVNHLSTHLLTEVISRISAPLIAEPQLDNQWSILLSHPQAPQ